MSLIKQIISMDRVFTGVEVDRLREALAGGGGGAAAAAQTEMSSAKDKAIEFLDKIIESANAEIKEIVKSSVGPGIRSEIKKINLKEYTYRSLSDKDQSSRKTLREFISKFPPEGAEIVQDRQSIEDKIREIEAIIKKGSKIYEQIVASEQDLQGIFTKLLGNLRDKRGVYEKEAEARALVGGYRAVDDSSLGGGVLGLVSRFNNLLEDTEAEKERADAENAAAEVASAKKRYIFHNNNVLYYQDCITKRIGDLVLFPELKGYHELVRESYNLGSWGPDTQTYFSLIHDPDMRCGLHEDNIEYYQQRISMDSDKEEFYGKAIKFNQVALNQCQQQQKQYAAVQQAQQQYAAAQQAQQQYAAAQQAQQQQAAAQQAQQQQYAAVQQAQQQQYAAVQQQQYQAQLQQQQAQQYPPQPSQHGGGGAYQQPLQMMAEQRVRSISVPPYSQQPLPSQMMGQQQMPMQMQQQTHMQQYQPQGGAWHQRAASVSLYSQLHMPHQQLVQQQYAQQQQMQQQQYQAQGGGAYLQHQYAQQQQMQQQGGGAGRR
jgi:hypothetical protein